MPLQSSTDKIEIPNSNREYKIPDVNGLSSLSTALGGLVIVKKETLSKVANGDVYRVNNKDDENLPYPAEVIVQMALKEVGKIKDYSLTSYNCEHFATELRYGSGFSDQVDDAVTYTVGAAAVLGLVAGVIYVTQRNRRQNQ